MALSHILRILTFHSARYFHLNQSIQILDLNLNEDTSIIQDRCVRMKGERQNENPSTPSALNKSQKGQVQMQFRMV